MNVPSQNILQLRELAEKLCMESLDNEYKEIILVMKKLEDDNKKLIANCKTLEEKIKCYEAMHTQMNKILQKIK